MVSWRLGDLEIYFERASGVGAGTRGTQIVLTNFYILQVNKSILNWFHITISFQTNKNLHNYYYTMNPLLVLKQPNNDNFFYKNAFTENIITLFLIPSNATSHTWLTWLTAVTYSDNIFSSFVRSFIHLGRQALNDLMYHGSSYQSIIISLSCNPSWIFQVVLAPWPADKLTNRQTDRIEPKQAYPDPLSLL